MLLLLLLNLSIHCMTYVYCMHGYCMLNGHCMKSKTGDDLYISNGLLRQSFPWQGPLLNTFTMIKINDRLISLIYLCFELRGKWPRRSTKIVNRIITRIILSSLFCLKTYYTILNGKPPNYVFVTIFIFKVKQ